MLTAQDLRALLLERYPLSYLNAQVLDATFEPVPLADLAAFGKELAERLWEDLPDASKPHVLRRGTIPPTNFPPMNTNTRLTPFARSGLFGWMFFVVVLCLAAFPFAVHAADAVPAVVPAPAAPIDAATQSWLLNLITLGAASHPWIASLLAFMGTARLWLKPVSSFAHSIVDLTPSKNDDALFNKVLLFFHENAIGRILAWTLDWLTSVKITKPTTPPTGF